MDLFIPIFRSGQCRGGGDSDVDPDVMLLLINKTCVLHESVYSACVCVCVCHMSGSITPSFIHIPSALAARSRQEIIRSVCFCARCFKFDHC